MSDTGLQSCAPKSPAVPPAQQLFGPIITPDGTRFQLWAPDAHCVSLVLHGHEPVALVHHGNGFWGATLPARPGVLYTFNVDGKIIPDPASRFQPSDVDGPSQLVDSSAYRWRNRSWSGRNWEETVLYELHPGIMGGFNGIRARLASLADLGITAIELMPIADFAGKRNWGYDGVLPFAPDSSYGTPDELRDLVDEAHHLGLMVFLDVVYNHFGPAGNHLPAYASGFFDKATPTPWGPAIEFANPVVRRFFIENALYWIQQFQVDGLRLDAVHAIKDRDWLEDLAMEVRARCPGRHIHLVLENENNDAALLTTGFTAQWNDDFHNVMHVLLTGESHSYYKDFAEDPAQQLARCLSQGFIYQGHPSPNRNGKPRGQPSAHLPPTSFVAFLQNHDQTGNRAFGERLTTIVPAPALQAAMALMLLCPQIPMLFMGEEYGATEPFLFFTDFHGELGSAVRDGRRREFAGDPAFAASAGHKEIPDPNSPATFAASQFRHDGAAAAEWRNLVKTLLVLRHQHIVPYLSSAKAAGAHVLGPKSIFASWQLGNGAALVLATNLSDRSVHADFPSMQPLFGDPASGQKLPPFTTLAWILP